MELIDLIIKDYINIRGELKKVVLAEGLSALILQLELESWDGVNVYEDVPIGAAPSLKRWCYPASQSVSYDAPGDVVVGDLDLIAQKLADEMSDDYFDLNISAIVVFNETFDGFINSRYEV